MQIGIFLAFAFCILYLKMSSGWERIRLRVETKESINTETEMRTISTHILDTSLGKAAANVPVTLMRLQNNGEWIQLNQSATNDDGRISQLLAHDQFQSGIYKLKFDVRPYFVANQVESFYPFIEIIVDCQQGQHYHIPLLLNPFGYSTYRGT